MLIPTLLAALVPFMPTLDDSSTQDAAKSLIVPPASSALSLPGSPDSNERNLMQLLEAFEGATSQTLVINDATQSMLAQTRFRVGSNLSVPPEEVYSFVENHLFHHGFLMCQLKSGKVPLFSVIQTTNRFPEPYGWVTVPEGQLPAYVHHPALLVQCTVRTDPIDARQLSTSMRALLTNTSYQRLMPLSESTIIVQGTGREVAHLAEMIKIGREEQRKVIESTPPEPPKQAGAGGR